MIYIMFGQRPLRYYLEDDEWGDFSVSLGSHNLELAGTEVDVYGETYRGRAKISKTVKLERDEDQVGGEVIFTREERTKKEYEDLWVKFKFEK